MEQWVPAEKPYRVNWIMVAGPELHGWRSVTKVFATFAEAIAALTVPYGRGVKYAEIDKAVNADDFARSGRWQKLARRDRKQTVRYTAAGRAEPDCEVR